MFLVSVGTAVASYFIPTTLGAVLFMTGFGFTLSLNLSEIGFAFKYCLINCVASQKLKNSAGGYKTQLGWRTLFFYLIILIFALLEAGLLHHFLGSHAFSENSLQAVISYVLMVLLLSTWILREIQTIYLFGIFRNPFYPKDVMTMNLFLENQKRLMKIGAFRKILLTLGKNLLYNIGYTGQLLIEENLENIACVTFQNVLHKLN